MSFAPVRAPSATGPIAVAEEARAAAEDQLGILYSIVLIDLSLASEGLQVPLGYELV